MSERRMSAYYYDFGETGEEAIDKILGAVACAGKAYHHTESWADKSWVYDDHTGDTPVDWIQNAAFEASEVMRSERAAHRALVEALEKIRGWREIDTPDHMTHMEGVMAFIEETASAAIAKATEGNDG